MNYYGKQTDKALENFRLPDMPVNKQLIYAITEIKKAAANANICCNKLDKNIGQAIITSCDEVLTGKFDDQFPTSAIQGGAGTSINMNVNEVLASRSAELLVNSGNTIQVHPIDHVNLSQSTNDVNPSALRIVCIRLTGKLNNNLDLLIKEIENKAKEYSQVKKLARTHLQDAIPTTIGDEFNAYAEILNNAKKRIEQSIAYLYTLNLGGTAIGNCINADPVYQDFLYKSLTEITQIPLKPSENMMSLTQTATDFANLSSVLTLLGLDLSKIAKDLRILSSGPEGGIGEIQLEELQKGSSIMPGKVNPVIPECINQIYYFIAGKNVTVQLAAEDSVLELAIMFPVIADSLIQQLDILSSGLFLFADKCFKTIKVDQNRCKELLEASTAYATLLTPKLGYDLVAEVVKESIVSGKTLREIILQRQLLNEEQFNKIISS